MKRYAWIAFSMLISALSALSHSLWLKDYHQARQAGEGAYASYPFHSEGRWRPGTACRKNDAYKKAAGIDGDTELINIYGGTVSATAAAARVLPVHHNATTGTSGVTIKLPSPKKIKKPSSSLTARGKAFFVVGLRQLTPDCRGHLCLTSRQPAKHSGEFAITLAKEILS